ncbi:MAG: PilT protein domain protein [Rhizobium sp.]|nr:PilT protein domain protein [Rhizobium sp.]
MRALLDTHTLLWWLADDPDLSHVAREVIADRDNDIFVSSASAWEIATKYAKGKLPSASVIINDLPGIISDEGFQHLPITSNHMVRSVFLPGDHRDPFDRILAAQSVLEEMPILSIDSMLAALGAQSVW